MSLTDKQEITEVLYRYARAVDRKDFDRVADCYFPDTIDHHGGYVGRIDGLIADMKSRHATIDSSIHYITNILIDIDGDRATAESYCLCYLRQASKDADGAQQRTTIKCRYIDKFERRADHWRIADRIVVFDEYATEPVIDQTDPSWVRAQRTPTDSVFTGLP